MINNRLNNLCIKYKYKYKYKYEFNENAYLG